ncbi:MAG TPA: peptidoglycan-binding domain-containing protein [Gammaproteobacteria bacterium]|nr:peptidoglycan-binding domain-containing protein [Gammaproteobacteria bacterium]
MLRILFAASMLLVAALPGLAGADELTAIVQKDLATLGYDPGSTDGEATVQTVVAVSKFQAEHELEVTGEITPQLAGVIKAAISKQGQPAPVAQAAPAPAAMDPAALQAAQQACLQRKIAGAQEAQQKRRGFSSLMRGLSRLGGDEIASSIGSVSAEIYETTAGIADLESAAKDLGIAESDVEACRNPQ